MGTLFDKIMTGKYFFSYGNISTTLIILLLCPPCSPVTHSFCFPCSPVTHSLPSSLFSCHQTHSLFPDFQTTTHSLLLTPQSPSHFSSPCSPVTLITLTHPSALCSFATLSSAHCLLTSQPPPFLSAHLNLSSPQSPASASTLLDP